MRTERLSAYEAAPAAMRAVQQVEAYIQQCGLEESLIELVKMRASQINGCAYCRHFDDRELVDLTTLIGLINLWNRLAIGFRYQHPVEPAR